MWLCRCQTTLQAEKLILTLVSKSVTPFVLSMQLYTYEYFYRRQHKTFTQECLVNFVICGTLYLLIAWSHYAASKDPGFVCNLPSLPSAAAKADQCKKCGVLKTDQVHHCRLCDKCVYLMDHHCTWTNNCLGYNTIKPFVLFNFYVCVLCLFGIRTIVHQISLQTEGELVTSLVTGVIQWRPYSPQSLEQLSLFCLLLGSGTFFSFSVKALLGFLQSVKWNLSAIDQVKLMNK